MIDNSPTLAQIDSNAKLTLFGAGAYATGFVDVLVTFAINPISPQRTRFSPRPNLNLITRPDLKKVTSDGPIKYVTNLTSSLK
jgi:hypothetical protein